MLVKPRIATEKSGKIESVMIGYYRDFGVRAETVREAVGIVRDVVIDGKIDEQATLVQDFEKLEPTVRSKYDALDTRPIWHHSGRIFFAPAIESL
jgi:hypothetical protein